MNDLFEKCGESASVGVINDIDRYDQMCFDAC